MSHKTNPRRIPATQADVDKAREQGVDIALTLLLWVLVDRHDATQAELDVFAGELDDLTDHIASGRIKLSDITETLRDEYNCTIECGRRLR